MIVTDFKKHGITKFTPAEVENTGATLRDVQLRLMLTLQAFRIIADRRIGLVFNGMTTGDHKALEHPAGLAVDGYFFPDEGAVNIPEVVEIALLVGFRGIGIYWNGSQFSFHLDLRPGYGFWYGSKESAGVGDWTFSSLFISA